MSRGSPSRHQFLASFWPTFDRRIGVLTLHEALKTGQALAHSITQVVCLDAEHLKIRLSVPALDMPLVVADSFTSGRAVRTRSLAEIAGLG